MIQSVPKLLTFEEFLELKERGTLETQPCESSRQARPERRAIKQADLDMLELAADSCWYG